MSMCACVSGVFARARMRTHMCTLCTCAYAHACTCVCVCVRARMRLGEGLYGEHVPERVSAWMGGMQKETDWRKLWERLMN